MFTLFAISTLIGLIGGLFLKKWAANLPKIQEEKYYAPSESDQMYLRSIGKM